MGWCITLGDRGGDGGQGVTPFIEIPTSRTDEIEEAGGTGTKPLPQILHQLSRRVLILKRATTRTAKGRTNFHNHHPNYIKS